MNTLKNIFRTYWRKAFRKRHYEFRQAFTEFSKSLMLIVDLNQLKDNVISKIREIIQVDAIFIYLFNPDINRFQLSEVRGGEAQKNNQLYFLPDDPLILWFTVNQTYLIISEKPQIFLHFANREQKILKETNIDFIFPLMAMNRVIGLICLSLKSSGDKINNEEIELLNIFLGQAALAFENAYLYQQQKARLMKMYRADRLATLGQLAAGAAHEIRNPLTSIRSTIQYSQKDLKDQAKRKMVAGILEEVDRINEIIEGLLSFSKPSKPKIEQVDLELLLQQSLTLAATTAKKRKIKIVLNFNAPQKYLKADPSQLKQVFLNIIMNAIEAMDDNGELQISVSLNEKIAQFTLEHQYSFRIIFQDSGEGIPQKNIEHIFDPFFTTKKDGTGLGLSISYGIIQQHCGDIEFESYTKNERPEEHGTKVTVTLPVLK